ATATSKSSTRPPVPTCLGCLPLATSSTTHTVRRSLQLALAARPHRTHNTSCPALPWLTAAQISRWRSRNEYSHQNFTRSSSASVHPLILASGVDWSRADLRGDARLVLPGPFGAPLHTRNRLHFCPDCVGSFGDDVSATCQGALRQGCRGDWR